MKTYFVDAFTDTPFKGNPAGVCLVEKELSEIDMLSIAAEFNFSETAFIRQLKNPQEYSIRYFSPKMEIPLCGHATLASAKVLFDQTQLEAVTFVTSQHVLLKVAQKDSWIEMEFPVYDTFPAEVPSPMLEALGLTEIANCEYNKETNILIIEVASADTVAQLQPDYDALLLSHDSIGGVIVMGRSTDGEYDFYYRHFWPWNGTNEDPVTGAVHTFLAPYWAKRLGKTQFKAYQASERTGYMEVDWVNKEKVLIRGEAVCVLEGEFCLNT